MADATDIGGGCHFAAALVDRVVHELADLRLQVGRLMAERDQARTEIKRLHDQRGELLAEMADLRDQVRDRKDFHRWQTETESKTSTPGSGRLTDQS